MIQEKIYTNYDIVYKYIIDHPYEIITPKGLTEKLGLKYNTVNSAINRLFISGKISKIERGKYTYNLPLPEGQKTLSEIDQNST